MTGGGAWHVVKKGSDWLRGKLDEVGECVSDGERLGREGVLGKDETDRAVQVLHEGILGERACQGEGTDHQELG